jgi:hypothetical protein
MRLPRLKRLFEVMEVNGVKVFAHWSVLLIGAVILLGAAVVTAKESRRVLLAPEPFVSADEAAHFLCVKRRYLLELARRGIAGAYALGTGSKRKIWVFRLSELAVSVVQNEISIPKPGKPCAIGSGSPR